MLGVSAERVFLLLCESMHAALADPKKQTAFRTRLSKFPMKPKLDWLHDKLQRLQQSRTAGVPDNAALMITVVYDLLRVQRNELGHPREAPPTMDREEAFVNLQVFPKYYATAEQLRDVLARTKV